MVVHSTCMFNMCLSTSKSIIVMQIRNNGPLFHICMLSISFITLLFLISLLPCDRHSVEVSASDFETHASNLTLTEAVWFHQEGHPELKCYSAPIKSCSKTWWSGMTAMLLVMRPSPM